MRALFYDNRSDEIVADKNLNQIGDEQTIYFKNDTNLVKPTFKITGGFGDTKVNYMYVRELDRYYFVRDIQYSRQCIYLICEEDVLCSWLSKLKEQTVIIDRNDRLYNLYLNDDKMKIYNYPYYQTLNMTCTEGTPFSMARNEICLALVGAV